MREILSSILIYGVLTQPPVKKLVFKGYRYEYEKYKPGGEIVLSNTDPYDMTKEYKEFRNDSIKVVRDSLRINKSKK